MASRTAHAQCPPCAGCLQDREGSSLGKQIVLYHGEFVVLVNWSQTRVIRCWPLSVTPWEYIKHGVGAAYVYCNKHSILQQTQLKFTRTSETWAPTPIPVELILGLLCLGRQLVRRCMVCICLMNLHHTSVFGIRVFSSCCVCTECKIPSQLTITYHRRLYRNIVITRTAERAHEEDKAQYYLESRLAMRKEHMHASEMKQQIFDPLVVNADCVWK